MKANDPRSGGRESPAPNKNRAFGAKDFPRTAPLNRVGDERARSFLRWAGTCGLLLAMALSFQGTRALWEPDEGFYASAALQMADGGNLLVPVVSGHVFLDKPPVLYWMMAAGVWLFGHNEWGLRFVNALLFAATAGLTGAIAGRLWGVRSRVYGTLAYGLMLAPFLAANVLTPDTALTFAACCVLYAYVRSVNAPHAGAARAWLLAAGVATGLAALTKGPACLVFAMVVPAHALVKGGTRRFLRATLLLGLPAVAIAAAWYVPIVATLPGAASYLWDNQVWGRVVAAHYDRNSGWAGALRVYTPVLLVGTLPWTGALARSAVRSLRRARRRWPREPRELLPALWIVLPLGVFTIARSRLPLYVLPVFPAIAVLAARLLARRESSRSPWRRRLALATWVLLAIALKGTLALWVSPVKWDDARLAQDLRKDGVGSEAFIVTIDSKWNGLAAYGYPRVVPTRLEKPAYPFFDPPEELADALERVAALAPTQIALVWAEPGDFSDAFPPRLLSGCSRRNGSRCVVLECGPQRVSRPERLSPAASAALTHLPFLRPG